MTTKIWNVRVAATWVSAASLATFPSLDPARAELYIDDFSSGLDATYWETSTNQPLYVVDDSSGEVEISKPIGGDYDLQIQRVSFRPPLLGDCAVEIDFREAFLDRVDGVPGNQVQLNVTIGDAYFGVVRSDEAGFGHNVHVFVDPPGAWAGARSVAEVAGTFRIERTGTDVTGYFNGEWLHTSSYPMGTEARVWLSLQNNGTVDSTHVAFDNFEVVSGDIVSTPLASSPSAPEPMLQLSANPVQESVWIRWAVSDRRPRDLRVYDVRGREVAVLTREDTPERAGRVEWQPDRSLAPGVYYLRLSSDGAPIVRSIVVRH